MKAIILNQPKDFSIKEIDKPQIKDDEVLIRVKASGICTNDFRYFNPFIKLDLPPAFSPTITAVFSKSYPVSVVI